MARCSCIQLAVCLRLAIRVLGGFFNAKIPVVVKKLQFTEFLIIMPLDLCM